MGLVIIYTHFGSNQPPVPLKIPTIASLTRETWAIVPKTLLIKDLTYLSVPFKAHFNANFIYFAMFRKVHLIKKNIKKINKEKESKKTDWRL